MEREIINFTVQYEIFRNNIDNLEIKIIETKDLTEQNRIVEIQNVYSTLGVKMRLAFGIKEIRLNNDFVSDKEDDLKLCHLLYYKLADLWFAYDTYLKFYKKVSGADKNNVDWIDANVHNNYSSSDQIILARNSANETFQNLYDNNQKRRNFIEYLKHCKTNASPSQKRRIDQIIIKIQQQIFDFTNSEILTISYAVRNNFVHNGETTVVPDNFGYKNKSKLLKVLYSYLTIVLLVSSNLTFSRI
ncbi:hypothetical protein [Chryseobacterium balustinum]|uniref:hypothetical protein n=1 Tax=Chryseobacterium balustinum TaxID=246 RepID=UPI003CF3EA27